MTTRTIFRVLRPLRGGAPRKHISHTVPRPQGWTGEFCDYARWRIMLRREGRNETNYINKH